MLDYSACNNVCVCVVRVGGHTSDEGIDWLATMEEHTYGQRGDLVPMLI